MGHSVPTSETFCLQNTPKSSKLIGINLEVPELNVTELKMSFGHFVSRGNQMNSWKSLILAGALLLISLPSYSQGRIGRDNRRFDPPIENINGEEFRLVEVLNRDFQGQNELAVASLFKLGQLYPDHIVKEVRVSAVSDAGRGQMQLKINQVLTGFNQTVPAGRGALVFQVPTHANIVGDTLQTLRLDIRGRVQIQNITLTLIAPTRRELIEKRYWQQFQGQNTINVPQVLGIGNEQRGKQLEYVELTAASFAGRAQAVLVINGVRQGVPQIIENFTSTLRFIPSAQTGTTVGADIRTVEILLVGQVRTDSLGVSLLSPSRRPTPVPVPLPRFVEKEVNILVTGDQNLNLQSLVADARFNNSRVASVEVTGRSARGNGVVRVCENLGFRTDCRNIQTLMQQQTFTSHYIGGARLSDLTLEARGQLVIQKVTVRFE